MDKSLVSLRYINPQLFVDWRLASTGPIVQLWKYPSEAEGVLV